MMCLYGFVTGVLGTLLGVLAYIKACDLKDQKEERRKKDKEFVLNLIEKEGIYNAYNIITFNFCGKKQYMKVWKEEFKKYLNKKEN